MVPMMRAVFATSLLLAQPVLGARLHKQDTIIEQESLIEAEAIASDAAKQSKCCCADGPCQMKGNSDDKQKNNVTMGDKEYCCKPRYAGAFASRAKCDKDKYKHDFTFNFAKQQGKTYDVHTCKAIVGASFPVVDKELHAKAVEILERFKVTIAVPEDLYALQDYDVVVIADDSGSMRSGSRWKELQDSLSQIVEIGSVFDDDGLDIYFLNRPVITGVRSAADKHFVDAFNRGPGGSTPLTHTLDTVMKVKSPKPVLLFILTDGVPDKGVRTFKNKIGSIVNNKKNPVKVQMMACTDDDKAVGWFDELDDAYDGVDVTDDYLTEKAQILRIGKVAEFTRGDWCIKAMLGPISRHFDELDEM